MFQAREAGIHVAGLVETQLQLDVARELGAKFLRLPEQAIAQGEDAPVALRHGRHEHRPPAVEAAEVFVLLVGPADLGHVTQPHHRRAVARHRRLPNLVERGKLPGGLHREAPVPEFDRAGRQVLVVAL